MEVTCLYFAHGNQHLPAGVSLPGGLAVITPRIFGIDLLLSNCPMTKPNPLGCLPQQASSVIPKLWGVFCISISDGKGGRYPFETVPERVLSCTGRFPCADDGADRHRGREAAIKGTKCKFRGKCPANVLQGQ